MSASVGMIVSVTVLIRFEGESEHEGEGEDQVEDEGGDRVYVEQVFDLEGRVGVRIRMWA